MTDVSTELLAVLSQACSLSPAPAPGPRPYLIPVLAILSLHAQRGLVQSFIMPRPCLNSSVAPHSFSSFLLFRRKGEILTWTSSFPQLGRCPSLEAALT